MAAKYDVGAHAVRYEKNAMLTLGASLSRGCIIGKSIESDTKIGFGIESLKPVRTGEIKARCQKDPDLGPESSIGNTPEAVGHIDFPRTLRRSLSEKPSVAMARSWGAVEFYGVPSGKSIANSRLV